MVAAGDRVLWARSRPPFDDAPDPMPGTIEHVLPDDWVFVRWVDKRGEKTPEAVYEAKWLRVITEDEFASRRDVLRASTWAGLPTEDPPEPMPRRFAAGDRVTWSGPQPGDAQWDSEATYWIEKALGGGVTPTHPGVVLEAADNAAVRVRWVDKRGTFAGEDFIRDDWLEPVTEQEFHRLSEQLRKSDWPGLRRERD